MLLWTSNWMLNKSSVEAWNRYIRTKTESAVADAQNKVAAGEGVGLGMVVSLAMLSFLAVFREGAETVIFYESIYSMSRDAQGMWIGGIAAGVKRFHASTELLLSIQLLVHSSMSMAISAHTPSEIS